MKQLILATTKFRKDDVDIRYASIDKRMSVYITNNCYLRLEGDVAMILGFEPGATISNSFDTSSYLSLSTGNVSSLYVYTGKSVTKTFDRPQYLSVCKQTLDTTQKNR